MDPCGGPDHPCTLAGVAMEVRERTREFAELIGSRVASQEELETAAGWLLDQGEIASAATGPGVLRFRLRGGRGHWIFIQPVDTVVTLGASAASAWPASRSLRVGPTHVDRGELNATVSTGAAWAPLPQGTTEGKEKKALLVSPFRWQWEIQNTDDGLDEIEKLLEARDYEGGVTLLTERLDTENPACRAGADRWPACRNLSDVTSRAFTSWNEYDYVHLVTHGGSIRTEDGAVKTGIMTPWTVEDVIQARERQEEAGRDDLVRIVDLVGLEEADIYVSGVLETDISWAGRGQTVRLDYPLNKISEVEGLPGPVPLNPRLRPSQRTICRRLLDMELDTQRIQAATEEEREALRGEREARGFVDQQMIEWGLAEEPDLDFGEVVKNALARVDGVVCGDYPTRVRTGPFVILTTRFFRGVYGDGVDDAFILISACGSGFRQDLLNSVKGENTAVLGWSESVSIEAAAEAGKLLARTLVQVDDPVEKDSGLNVGQAIRKVRTLIEEARNSAPSEEECLEPTDPAVASACALQFGSPLTVLNDVPADALTGATLTFVGDTAIRAREIPYLLAEDGRELKDGASMAVVGTGGDGLADSLDLRFRVDGLELEEEPERVGLKVRVDDRIIDVEEPLDREVAEGVWELEHRLPLGRDHEAGERVDLEVVALLPRGGESRWTYEEIELSSPICSWEATVGGASVAGGRINAMWGTAHTTKSVWPPLDIDAVVQTGDPQPEAPWLVISLTNQGSGPRMQDLEDWREIKLAVPGVRPGATGTFSRVWGTLSAGSRTFDGNAEYLRRDVVGLPGGTGIGNLLTTEVSLSRYDDERVEGRFTARFLDPSALGPEERTPPGVGIHTFSQAEIRASGEFSILMDQSCGTAAGVGRMRQR